MLAHEIGHHVYHHITKMILLGLVYTGVSFFVCDRVLVGWVTAIEDIPLRRLSRSHTADDHVRGHGVFAGDESVAQRR